LDIRNYNGDVGEELAITVLGENNAQRKLNGDAAHRSPLVLAYAAVEVGGGGNGLVNDRFLTGCHLGICQWCQGGKQYDTDRFGPPGDAALHEDFRLIFENAPDEQATLSGVQWKLGSPYGFPIVLHRRRCSRYRAGHPRHLDGGDSPALVVGLFLVLVPYLRTVRTTR